MSNRKRLKRLSVFNKPELTETPVNPFVNSTTIPSLYEKIKLVMMAPVAVVRISACIATILVLAVSCKVITLGLSKEELKNKPLSKFRRTLLWLALKLGGRTFLFALGFHWITYRGRQASRKEAPIVVANHTCMIDPFVLGQIYVPSAVGAQEHLQMPIVGWIFEAQQLITVDRKDPNSRSDVKNQIRQRAQADSPWPQQTIIFPEATCTNGKALITFRGGPFAPGVPVQPVVVRFPATHFHPCWVQSGPGMGMIFYRLACQFHNYITVDFLPPHVPNAQEKANAILYGNHVRERMAEKMQVPCTWHSYSDVRLQIAARKLGLAEDVGVVGMQGVQEAFGHNIRADTVQKHLKAFATMDVERTGHINMAQFAKGFQVEVTPSLISLFNLLDNDGSGFLDFREYLLGLALLNESNDRSSILKLVFQVFDADGSKTLSITELSSFLVRCGYGDVDVGSVLAEATGRKDATSMSYEAFESLITNHPEFMQLFTNKLNAFG